MEPDSPILATFSLGIHWLSRVFMKSTLSSFAVHAGVITTNCGPASDDKFGISLIFFFFFNIEFSTLLLSKWGFGFFVTALSFPYLVYWAVVPEGWNNRIQWVSTIRIVRMGCMPDCSAWWRHQMETFSALLALCEGNPPVTGGFPSQRSATESFDVFFDLRLNKRLSNNRDTGDLRRHRSHHDVTVMGCQFFTRWSPALWVCPTFQKVFLCINLYLALPWRRPG